MEPVPPVVTAYFDLGGHSSPEADALAELFTEDAVVVDDGTTWTGRDGVRAWKTRTSSQFSYTTTVVAARASGAAIEVIGHLEGDFPGGEVELTYTFALAGELIARLDITA